MKKSSHPKWRTTRHRTRIRSTVAMKDAANMTVLAARTDGPRLTSPSGGGGSEDDDMLMRYWYDYCNMAKPPAQHEILTVVRKLLDQQGEKALTGTCLYLE